MTTSVVSSPPVITNVATANLTSTSVTVTWTTDQPSSSLVNYGTTTGYGSSSTLNTTLVLSLIHIYIEVIRGAGGEAGQRHRMGRNQGRVQGRKRAIARGRAIVHQRTRRLIGRPDHRHRVARNVRRRHIRNLRRQRAQRLRRKSRVARRGRHPSRIRRDHVKVIGRPRRQPCLLYTSRCV